MRVVILFLLISSTCALPSYKGILSQDYTSGEYSSCFFRDETHFRYAFNDEGYSQVCSNNLYLNQTQCYSSNNGYIYREDDIEVGTLGQEIFYTKNNVTHLYLYNSTFPSFSPFRVYHQKGVTLSNDKIAFFDENGIKEYPLSFIEFPSFFIVNKYYDLILAVSRNYNLVVDLLYPSIRAFPRSTVDAPTALCSNENSFYIERQLYFFDGMNSFNVSTNLIEVQYCEIKGPFLYLSGTYQNNRLMLEKHSLVNFEIVYSFVYPYPILSPQYDSVTDLFVDQYNQKELILVTSRGTGGDYSSPELFIIFPELNYSLNFTTEGRINEVDYIKNKILVCGIQDLYILEIEEEK